MGTAKKATGTRATTTTATKKRVVAKAPAKKKAPAAKKPEKRPVAPKAAKMARPGAENVTLAALVAITERLDLMTERLATIESLLRATQGSFYPPSSAPPLVQPTIASGDFEAALLATVSDLDRRARHGGMVPIPEVREVFLDAGWTRTAFDARLLDAEREFVVDLKVANDPKLLLRPDLAIEEIGRGHLQYVVIR